MMTKRTLCTFNIQAGIGTVQMPHYLTRLHGQFFDSFEKRQRLKAIGEAIANFDIVCLQEVDLGGRRSGFSNQLDIIRQASGHEFFALQQNRQIGKISRHGNVTLSHHPIITTHDHKLPGKFPGRGALITKIDLGAQIHFINAHLSLGTRDQTAQLASLRDYIENAYHVVLAGDLNINSNAPHLKAFAEEYEFVGTWDKTVKTYPSWRPRKAIDHIVMTRGIRLQKISVMDVQLSDHCPIAVSFEI